MSDNRVIAIDGPSASGKSTVARKVAGKTGDLYVDSGALYRGMTWKVLQEGVNPEESSAVLEVMNAATWDFTVVDGAVRFTIDGVDPGEAIRGEAVRENVSFIARIPEVRKMIVANLRGMRTLGNLVVEGRDIGSAVFPDSGSKYYLDADPEERARRRNAELEATEGESNVKTVLHSLKRRDEMDSTRKTDPLQVAEGARIIDSTHLTLDQVVEVVLEDLKS